MTRTLILVSALIFVSLLAACSGSDDGTTSDATATVLTAVAQPTATPVLPTPAATAAPSPTATVVLPTSTPVPQPTATPATHLDPTGLPIAPDTRLGAVVGNSPNRTIDWLSSLRAATYSANDQVSGDPVTANLGGWNCRVHQEYEAAPAVDWYIPTGTEVRSTMDGTARLFIVTTSNAFDVYGVSREPYIGNPDRARAALSPFPGSGGGKGIFVRVENGAFTTEYAHLDPSTVRVVPAGAFLAPYAASFDFATAFRALRDFQSFTEVASWPVRRGDVIGLSGDTGYSEAPHLHYTVRRAGGPLLCPTNESGFSDGDWLSR